MAYERLHGSALRHFCNAVVWIAELVHVKKSWKLVEINLTTFIGVDRSRGDMGIGPPTFRTGWIIPPLSAVI